MSDPKPGVGPKRLPDSRDYTFDKPLHGLGWHLQEHDGQTWFRWTGPEREAWLELAWHGRGAGLLRCRVLHAAAPRILESLQVRVDGHSVPLHWRSEGREVEIVGEAPASVLAARKGRVRISFHVSEVVRPCDVEPGSGDTRSLGLALSLVSLTSADGTVVDAPSWWGRLGQWLKPGSGRIP
jgi:hypothetical protein